MQVQPAPPKGPTMHLQRCLLSIGLAALAGGAAAESGLKLRDPGGFWSVEQTSIRLNAVMLEAGPLRTNPGYDASTARAPVAASITGDYYFAPAAAEGQADTARSGFRASSALLIRPPGVPLSELALSSRSAASFGVPMRLSLPSVAPGYADPSAYSISTMPYVGIGYSGMSPKSGWGFWADIGLVVQSPGSAVGLGRVLSGTQSVDDLLRDLRLTPLVQLGVNYSF